ncbi:MAG: CobW family GTP-binding protein [Candidatus Spyradocola sp.]
MSGLYLVTGFLGAGKTTFLREFLPLFRGQRVHIIVNEFGKEGVDGALLAELDAQLREISGGSVFCACRLDQFERALREAAADAPDVIVVEASGLSDPTGVRRLLGAERFPGVEYRGAVCLIDAVRFPKVYATARACTRQLAASDAALLNKCDLADKPQLAKVRELIAAQRPDLPVIETTYGKIPPNFLSLLAHAQNGDREHALLVEDLTHRRATIHLNDTLTASELTHFLSMFAEQTYRIKGFVETRDKGALLVDAVGTQLALSPAPGALPSGKLGVLTVLSGAGMPLRKAVGVACAWYGDAVIRVEYR